MLITSILFLGGSIVPETSSRILRELSHHPEVTTSKDIGTGKKGDGSGVRLSKQNAFAFLIDKGRSPFTLTPMQNSLKSMCAGLWWRTSNLGDLEVSITVLETDRNGVTGKKSNKKHEIASKLLKPVSKPREMWQKGKI